MPYDLSVNTLKSLQVLMMTPQILLNILQHGFFTMDKIELLIFDECHHAQKNHPYSQIMKVICVLSDSECMTCLWEDEGCKDSDA